MGETVSSDGECDGGEEEEGGDCAGDDVYAVCGGVRGLLSGGLVLGLVLILGLKGGVELGVWEGLRVTFSIIGCLGFHEFLPHILQFSGNDRFGQATWLGSLTC